MVLRGFGFCYHRIVIDSRDTKFVRRRVVDIPLQLTFAVNFEKLQGAASPLSDALLANPPTCETSGGSHERMGAQAKANVVAFIAGQVPLSLKDFAIVTVKAVHPWF